MAQELTLWSLNCGRLLGKTPDEESQTLKSLKGLSEPNATIPDVLCLQDIPKSALQYLMRYPYRHFAPMTNHWIWGKREFVGIAIASRYPIEEDTLKEPFTYGDGEIRDLEGVDDCNQRIKPDEVADQLVLQTEARRAIMLSVDDGEQRWRIATTHGQWTRGGEPKPEQRESTARLVKELQEDAWGNHAHGLIAIGDFNFDREGEMYQTFIDNGARHFLPLSIESTLSPAHPGYKFKAKPDRVFSWPDEDGVHRYRVTNVYLDPTPGSDHQMLCCTVSKAV